MTQPAFRDMVRAFARIGAISFGGPAGQIALMHEEIVEKRQWIDEGQFLRALNLCHLLPGPEAQQLATWIGWRLHGARGGLVSGLLFVIPGALVILALSLVYCVAAGMGWFAALFLGVKAAVLAIVVQALIRIGKRALNTQFKVVLAIASFVALFFLNLPFPLVVLGSGALGILVAAMRPQWLRLGAPPAAANFPPRRTLLMKTLLTIVCWMIVWAAPMLLILVTLGADHILWSIGTFFAKLAVVTFGGAYAVLSYMAQEAVQVHHWLSAREMADGLGMAETTPGPLIMVTEFVGFIAAYRTPAPFSPIIAGIIGAALTVWVTFAPCFLSIFALAPWLERLEHARKLQGGLAALTAAVVGVIANLVLWFTLHVLFGVVGESVFGPLRLFIPDWSSIDWRACVLGLGAAILLFRFRIGVLPLLGLAAAGGLALSVL